MGGVPHVALAAVCIPSVGFLLWFLIGLARDERRERGRRFAFLYVASGSSEKVIGKAATKAGRSVYERAAAGFETAGSSYDQPAILAQEPAQSQVCVLRLPDKRAENTVKLRWLIMTLVLSAGVGGAIGSSNQPTAGSPDPLLRITRGLEPASHLTLIPDRGSVSRCV